MKMKFAAVVVLYNPQNNVIDNIKSYGTGIGKIYAIDNSDKEQNYLSHKLRQLPNLEYISFGENKGIAYALNYALNKAIEEKFDFLLTMDQDTSFAGNNATEMINFVSENYFINHIALYAANTEEYFGNDILTDVNLALTSGNIIHCKTVKKIGGFDDKLFIDWVDQDLCYRLVSAGYKLARLNKIKINHNLGENAEKKIFGLRILYNTHSNIRYYYMVRNKFYVLKKNKKGFMFKLRFLIGTLLMIFKIITIENDKVNKLKFIYDGVKDYRFLKMGKYSK